MKQFVICLILFFSLPLFAQHFAAGAKFFGLSIHPKGAVNAPLIPAKFDSRGVFVLHPGVSLNFEYFVWKDIVSVKAVQGIHADCAMQFAGFSHVGFRVRLFNMGKFSMNFGIGPTFIYRKNWYKLPGYDPKFVFLHGTKDDEWQHRFIWYGGEIESNFRIRNTDISVSVIPGGLDLINISFGFRQHFGKEPGL